PARPRICIRCRGKYCSGSQEASSCGLGEIALGNLSFGGARLLLFARHSRFFFPFRSSQRRASSHPPSEAYHMIDTCDPTICGWSEDGSTFVVKDPSKFETVVIPQFFKHNKFSSFVRQEGIRATIDHVRVQEGINRQYASLESEQLIWLGTSMQSNSHLPPSRTPQLNFYGFRKVKFSNSLRIDHKLEAETSKYWRFRHDKFRKGRRDLLIEIKRTPSASSAAAAHKPLPPRAGVVPSAPMSSASVLPLNPKVAVEKKEEVTHLKTEMKELKERIASMTKNIDDLTDLVKKVSVKDEEASYSPVVSPGAVGAAPGSKRKKMEEAVTAAVDPAPAASDLPALPDWNPSSSDLAVADSMMDLGEPLPDLPMSSGSSPAPSPVPSDDTFVDDLFQAFATEDGIVPGLEEEELNATKEEELNVTEDESDDDENPNKPDPRVMKRIEDSLSTLPRDLHEMVADRLVAAISDAQPAVEQANRPQAIADEEEEEEAADTSVKGAPSIPLPLAVATLKAILKEHGVSVECRRAARSCKDAAFGRSIPVVPMHA
ncbi:hypothetical protein ACHAWF_016348, partial [Thalassiosira exigua]